jgi:pyruvate dehydrogenase E1 component alpha subunit
VASRAIRRARAKEGPTLIECKTYRWRGHHEGDPNQGERYRQKSEIEAWKKKDPIERLAKRLVSEKVASRNKLAKIEKQLTGEIDEAVAYAENSDFPAVEDLFQDVYTTLRDHEPRR